MSFVEDLEFAARAGDWDRLESLAEELPHHPSPVGEPELAQYLFQLQTALIAARTTRADLVKSLHRLTAAAQFNQPL